MSWSEWLLFALSLSVVIAGIALTLSLRTWKAATVILIGAIAALLVVALGPGWSGMMGHGSMMGGMGSGMGSGETKRDASSPVQGAPQLEVSAREFAFSPSTLEMKAGEVVNIRFQNDGSMFHTFTIENQQFSLDAQAGDSVSGSIKLPAGTYEFICSVPGHASSGMRGTITVR